MDLEDYLRQFRWRDPAPDLRPRILAATIAPAARTRRWPWLLGAAAALVALGLGLWLWQARLSPTSPPDPPRLAGPADSEGEPAAVPLFGGRGRLLPVADGTRFTVLDSERGRVRLEQGEVYVELEPGAGGAEVQTPAGTARALGTRFYAHYAGERPALLAVAVLGGTVEVDNAHGRTTCGAGEVALAQADAAPHRHAEPSGRHHPSCPFAGSLGLIYRPQVQAELRLSEEQKARLQRPGADERREMCRFFRGLHGLPRSEWAQRSREFCGQLERKLAEVLTPAQHQRLRQIGYQQEGYFALLRNEVGAELHVTPEQRRGIEKALTHFAAARRALLAGNLPPPERDRQVAAAWRRALAQAEQLLNDAQKDRLGKLVGPPLPLPPPF